MRLPALLAVILAACSAEPDDDFSPWDNEPVESSGGKEDGARPVIRLAGIGDSIMQGVDADEQSFLEDRPENAFLLGDGIDSVSERLRAKGYDVQPWLTAVTGATMVDGDGVEAQARSICAAATRPTRVVILLGGNDVCTRATVSPVYQFRDALRRGLDTLGQCLPRGARVVVLTVPRVDQLFDAQAELGPSCQLAQSAGICARVMNGSADGRAALGNLVDEYNDGIGREVQNAARRYPKVGFRTDWEGKVADTSLGTHRFVAGDISRLDCFHPRRDTGQRKIACIAWDLLENGGRGKQACFR